MRTRKEFLAAAAAMSAFLAARAGASGVPPASPKKPKVSTLARDFAQRMRAFDSKLTDAQLADIAEGIDAQLNVGKYVNPRGEFLKNSDEPSTTFRAIG